MGVVRWLRLLLLSFFELDLVRVEPPHSSIEQKCLIACQGEMQGVRDQGSLLHGDQIMSQRVSTDLKLSPLISTRNSL